MEREDLHMAEASIQLSEQETQALRVLAEQTGKTQDELLHDAVTQLLTQSTSQARLALLQQARGIWKERTDLLELDKLRAEFDRVSSRA